MKGSLGTLLGFTAGCLLIVGCADGVDSQDIEQRSTTPDENPLEWQMNEDGGKFVLSDDFAIRCWPIGPNFDCLLAQISDDTQTSADSPVYWDYFRFLSARLPTVQTDLELLSRADGYACSSSKRGNTLRIREEIWKGGKAEVSDLNEVLAYEGTTWTPHRVREFFASQKIFPVRPYFECVILDGLVRSNGLDVLQTPLVDYGAVMLADRIEEPQITPSTLNGSDVTP